MSFLPTLTDDFFAAPPSSLKTARVNTYHFGRTVLIGDSSHTMVPFFGRGITAFTDIPYDEVIHRHGADLDTLLSAVFDEVTTTGMVHPHPGAISHIPSGELFQAAIGQFARPHVLQDAAADLGRERATQRSRTASARPASVDTAVSPGIRSLTGPSLLWQDVDTHN